MVECTQSFFPQAVRPAAAYLAISLLRPSGEKKQTFSVVLGAVADYRHFVLNERCSFERGEGRRLFLWKKNRHFWSAACGFAWLLGRFGDEEVDNITNSAHVEAFIARNSRQNPYMLI